MNVPIIYTGGDYPIEFALTDSAGDVLDLSIYDNYVVHLYYKNFAEATILAKYAKDITDLTGYKALKETDAANGVFVVQLESDDTLAAPNGYLYAEIKTQRADLEYEDNTFDSIMSNVTIAKVLKSTTEDVL